jgi:hypothetical protein
MNRLGHLSQIGAFFQTGLGVGINAIRALNGVGNGEGDQALFSLCQLTLRKYRCIIVKKSPCQLRGFLPYIFEPGQILGSII